MCYYTAKIICLFLWVLFAVEGSDVIANGARSEKWSAHCFTAEWLMACFSTGQLRALYYISCNKFKVYTTLFAIVQWKALSRVSCFLFLWSEIPEINMYSSKTVWFSAILWETLTVYLNKCKHWVLQPIKYLMFFLVDHLKALHF